MAKYGDEFTITLSETHLGWGTYRYTMSRKRIYGEGYIPIPSGCAQSFQLFNSNNNKIGLGYNEFNCRSSDGFYQGIVKTSGCSKAKDIYAKNLHGSGDLKALGRWFEHLHAQPGDKVTVKWTSPTDIIISLIKK